MEANKPCGVWVVRTAGRVPAPCVKVEDGPTDRNVARFETVADAERAVACVNALAGLDPAGLAGVLAGADAVLARLTAAARAFYGAGSTKALRAALDNWRADADALTAALAALRGKGG